MPRHPRPDVRNLVLIAVFLALAGLEVGHGLFRLRALRERSRLELLSGVEHGHVELAQALRSLQRQGRDHAAHLARTPAVQALLAADADRERARAEAERFLLPYLVSFPTLDRVRVLGPDGAERVRCERVGAGAGALPPGLLAAEPASVVAELLGGAAGVVVSSEMREDVERVQVTASQRLVQHHAVRVDGPTRGALVLTVHAEPMLRAVTRFEPVAGSHSLLVARDGSALMGGARFDEQYPEAARALAGGAPRWVGQAGGFVARSVDPEGAVRLVTVVPASALARALRPLRAEHLWILGSMVGVMSLLGVAAAVVYRMNVRDLRAREAERRSEGARRESARYRALLDGAADAVLSLDPETGRVRGGNARARALLAADADGDLDDALGEDERARLAEALRTAVAAPGQAVDVGELHLRGPGDRPLVADGRAVAIEVEGEPVVQLSLRDLTRQREMERQLQTAERLSSLGLLTAGVAHEINNPLEGIGNYVELLDQDGLDGGRRRRYLEQLRFGLGRIRDIVRDLLSFARPPRGAARAEIATAVQRVLKMVRYSKDLREVRFDVGEIDPSLAVAADPGGLEQVLLNLVLNAATAMEGQGRIAVGAHFVPGPPPLVELVVEDEGPGIPPEDRARVFDPFFTRSGGTGLGLSISYGIVRAHGGDIAVEEAPGGGARLVARFPAAAGTASEGAA